MIYLIGAILTFIYLSEAEATIKQAPLTQRQLTMCLCSAIVWPILALSLLNENKQQLKNNLEALLGVNFAELKVPTQLKWPAQNLPDQLQVDKDTL
jgi:hypothetical protein